MTDLRHPNGHRLLSASEAKAAGWLVDDTVYPLVAYKGARFQPDEIATVLPDAWALDLDELFQLRKRPPTAAELALVDRAMVRFHTSDGRMTPLPISDEVNFRNYTGARISVVRVMIEVPGICFIDWAPPPPAKLPQPLEPMKVIRLQGLKTSLAGSIVDLLKAHGQPKEKQN